MPTRILHVSDLHFGARDDPILEQGLASLIERVAPELVIASGDLTNRGRRDQHELAAGFLRRLGAPLLAVPIAAVVVTLFDVILRDVDPAEEEMPTVLFPARESEA